MTRKPTMQTEPQVLDNEALKYIKIQRENKVPYQILVEELNTLGYRTVRGNKLHPADVCKFATTNGVRSKVQYVKGKNRMKTSNFDVDKMLVVYEKAQRQGKTDKQLARIFNKHGFTTRRGMKFTWKTVNNFKYRYGKAGPSKDVQTTEYQGAPLKEVTKTTPKPTNDILDIVASNLPKHLKLKLLSEMV